MHRGYLKVRGFSKIKMRIFAYKLGLSGPKALFCHSKVNLNVTNIFECESLYFDRLRYKLTIS